MSIKMSQDLTILARLNEEQRIYHEEMDDHLDYDNVRVNDASFSGTRLSADHQRLIGSVEGEHSWQPHY